MPLLVSRTKQSPSVSNFRLHGTYACCLNAFVNETLRNTREDLPPFALTVKFFWQLFWWGWGIEKSNIANLMQCIPFLLLLLQVKMKHVLADQI